MTKTIFITCYNPFISRNILGSEAFEILKKDPTFQLVIFAPSNKKEFLEHWYGGSNVIIEPLDVDDIIRSKKNKFWYRMAFLIQNTYYVQDQRKEHLYQSWSPFRHINYFIVNLSATILSKLPLARKLYRFLDYTFSPRNILDPYIIRYQPNLLFSTDAFSEPDALFQRSAKFHRIPIISMVRSWDNTTTKGILRIKPQKMIANSPTIKEELIVIHDIPEDVVIVVGLPQFDDWPKGPTVSRDEFFRAIGGDSERRLILFAPAGSNLSDTDWQICQILKDSIASGLLPSNVQFLIRNHPHHPADLSKFNPDNHFIIETPGLKFERVIQAELRPDDNSHLLNSIYYSEMVIYIVTSLGLDSSVFDKPQVIVNFDGWEQRPYVKSVVRYHNEDCLRSLIKCNGTRVAKNADELINSINSYLYNPKLDEEGRKNIVKRHLYKIDGQAGKRIAETILAML